AAIFRPASKAALKPVVETWQTPPPRPVVTSPFTITGATRNPFAAVRSPVVLLKENSAPGAISLSSTRRATSCTLWIRFGTPPYSVVYVDTRPLMPMPRAAAAVESRRAAGREREQRREARRREQEACRPEEQPDGRGQRQARLVRRASERDGANLRPCDAHRQRDRCRRAVERGELPHECRRCGGLVERPPRTRGKDRDARAAQREQGIARRLVDRVRHAIELVVERAGQDGRRRGDGGA